MTQEIKPPDLNALYDEAAAKHHESRNPVIVIPGILGSRLVDRQTGLPVWGMFDGAYLDPSKHGNAAMVALPMQRGKALRALKDSVEADVALDRLKIRVFGVPVEAKAYAGILETLGAAGYQDQQLAEAGAIDYGNDHFTCFQFAYDWRRSNVENAGRLAEFIREKEAYVRKKHREVYGKDRGEIKFDIVAHSMGGLIARYYLRYGGQSLPSDGSLPQLNWAGARHVNQLIMVGTPNSGSVLAFEDLAKGKKFAPGWAQKLGVVSIPNYSTGVLGTYPSLYELMPRTRHRAYVDDQTDDIVNVYDVGNWERYGWGLMQAKESSQLDAILSKVSDRVERREIARDHLRKCLKNAEQFQRSLDKKVVPPVEVKLRLVAGDAVATKERVQIQLDSGVFEATKYGPGDGIVLRSSALGDERVGKGYAPKVQSSMVLDDVLFLFRDHLTMTQDPIFSDNVLYRLLEE
ncbi:lipase family alpha/beta hydrolase [Rubritalea tangerina]|uniref:Lipase family alpha/beta hydrolase n=1 Tax=Rubritalea tangerina TaxID=430798 RepID=A0ABW4Z9N3_9BACT